MPLKHKTLPAGVDQPGFTGVTPSLYAEEHSFTGGAQGALLIRNTLNSDGADWVLSTVGVLVSSGANQIPIFSSTAPDSVIPASAVIQHQGVLTIQGSQINGALPSAVQDLITRTGIITSGIWNAGAVTSSGGISGTTGTFSSTLASTGEASFAANALVGGLIRIGGSSGFTLTNNSGVMLVRDGGASATAGIQASTGAFSGNVTFTKDSPTLILTDTAGTTFKLFSGHPASVPMLVIADSSDAELLRLSPAGHLTVKGTGGWTIGSIGGAARIQYSSSNFSLLTESDTGATLTWGGGSAISSSSNVALLNAANSFTARQTQLLGTRGSGDNYFQFSDTTGLKGYIGYGGVNDVYYVANLTANNMVFVTNSKNLTFDTTGTLTIPNTLVVQGLGLNSFIGTGAGAQILKVQSASAGTTNQGAIQVVADTAALNLGTLSSTYSASTIYHPNGSYIVADGVWGLTIAAAHATGEIWFAAANAAAPLMKFDTNTDFIPVTDNTQRVGAPTARFSLIRGVTITPGDLEFENGWAFTESWKVGIDAEGIAMLDANGELVAFFGRDGFRAKGLTGALDIDDLPYVPTTSAERAEMDLTPEIRGKRIEDIRAKPNSATGQSNKQRLLESVN